MSTSVASDDDFALAYDVERTARWIRRGDRRRIALQLPDDKLPDAARLATTLRRALDRDDPGGESAVEREVFVLADTTFGACCVDEVAAAHRDADAIVHFGRACCSPTSRTPARLVFDRRGMDVERCVRAIRAHATRLGAIEGEGRPRAVVAVADQEYFWALDAARRSVAKERGSGGVDVIVAEGVEVEVVPRRDAGVEAGVVDDGRARVGASRFALPTGVAREECAYVWIGGAGPSMTHAMLVLSDCAERFGGLAQYDPSVDEEVRTEAEGASEAARALKRRRFAIAKAKEARVVGILAGTLGVAGYRDVIANLRQLIAKSGRKSYTVVAGRPNPQKLANFPEIEVFVMVSCELTALMDGRDYMQPIITPYEASIAFTSGKMWMGEVKLDFASVPSPGDEAPDDDDDDDEPEYSLISGTHRSSKMINSHDTVENGDALTGTELARRAEGVLSLRASGASGAVTASGAEYLITKRTYTGLQPGPKRDEDTGAIIDAPLDAARGLSGRARSYAAEPARRA
tara:strand:+ start:2194 stop:3750 length:1557 start_codon:yes stop_codon:yes gene_type:complete